MSKDKKDDIIAKAKKQFDKDFFTEGYIDIISDDKHLEKILNNIDVKTYDVEVIEDRIYITEDVLNMSFRKTS